MQGRPSLRLWLRPTNITRYLRFYAQNRESSALDVLLLGRLAFRMFGVLDVGCLERSFFRVYGFQDAQLSRHSALQNNSTGLGLARPLRAFQFVKAKGPVFCKFCNMSTMQLNWPGMRHSRWKSKLFHNAEGRTTWWQRIKNVKNITFIFYHINLNRNSKQLFSHPNPLIAPGCYIHLRWRVSMKDYQVSWFV